MICAIARNRAIGKNNELLWHIPEDFKRFKEITSGHAVFMGEKTFRSIGKALPDRTNIVISQDENFKAEGCLVFNNIEDALAKAREIEKDEIFVIGGGMIYKTMMPLADKLYLTVVEGDFEADTFFPDYSDFKKIIFEKDSADANYKYKFLELTR